MKTTTVLLSITLFLYMFETYLTLQGAENAARAIGGSEYIYDSELYAFQVWVLVELSLSIGIMLSNVVFLLVRSFKRNELLIELEDYYERRYNMKQFNETAEQKDFMETAANVMGIFQSYFVPVLITGMTMM